MSKIEMAKNEAENSKDVVLLVEKFLEFDKNARWHVVLYNRRTNEVIRKIGRVDNGYLTHHKNKADACFLAGRWSHQHDIDVIY